MNRVNEESVKKFGALPEKVLQFGEGNFLRSFADWIIESMNRKGEFNGSIVLAQPIEKGNCDRLNEQDCVYTVLMRGVENGKVVKQPQVITSVSRCINSYTQWDELVRTACQESIEIVISNTTESGIVFCKADSLYGTPNVSYPAKLTALLYERYIKFNGDLNKGWLILPVELVENNGKKLKECVFAYIDLWKLPNDFKNWCDKACYFTSTLVDRIVTGFPRDEYDKICNELGYKDELLSTCEPFLFWAIEGREDKLSKFPVKQTGFDIVISENIQPYRTRKVRILNGMHTASILAAYLCEHEIVLDMMNDSVFNEYLRDLAFKEIMGTIDLPESELKAFADAVFERFSNPFIKHRLLDISLNSISKYKARCLPTLKDYYATSGVLPKRLTLALAALIFFYRCDYDGEKYLGFTGKRYYEVRDSAENCAFMSEAWKNGSPAEKILANKDFWGENLNEISGLTDAVREYLDLFEANGVYNTIRSEK